MRIKVQTKKCQALFVLETRQEAQDKMERHRDFDEIGFGCWFARVTEFNEGETKQIMGLRRFIVITLLFITSALFFPRTFELRAEEGVMDLDVTSSAFGPNGLIPRKYTCDGDDVSPPLAWSGVPQNSANLVLISDDPDAPMGTWVHWVLYDLPPQTASLPEHVPPLETLASGAQHGRTDFGKLGYGGPCPPSGTHRYFFKLYALDVKLNLDSGATKKQVEKAMKGHILAEGNLVGRYKRQRD